MTKEERLLYYKEGYKNGWADAMRRIRAEADDLMFKDKAHATTQLTDVQISGPREIKIPQKGKKKKLMQVAELLNIWRTDKSKMPKEILFRGYRFIFQEHANDFVCRETDSYGDWPYFWDFIENPDILNETVEVV